MRDSFRCKYIEREERAPTSHGLDVGRGRQGWQVSLTRRLIQRRGTGHGLADLATTSIKTLQVSSSTRVFGDDCPRRRRRCKMRQREKNGTPGSRPSSTAIQLAPSPPPICWWLVVVGVTRFYSLRGDEGYHWRKSSDFGAIRINASGFICMSGPRRRRAGVDE